MRKFGADPIYLLISGTMSLCLSMVYTIEMVYRIQAVGLNPLQLVIIGTLLLCVHLIFQTPMGILAGMYSRRLAMYAHGRHSSLKGPGRGEMSRRIRATTHTKRYRVPNWWRITVHRRVWHPAGVPWRTAVA